MGVAEFWVWASDFFSKVYSRFVVAIIVLLIGIIVGRLVGKILQKILAEFEVDKVVKKTTHIRVSVEEIITGFVTYFIYFVAIIMSLDQLGVTTTVLHIVSLGIIVIVIASILLGVRDILPNVVSGFFIFQKRFIKKGDKIKVGEVEGVVVEVNLVETRIKTKKGDIIYVPNSLLMKQEVVKLA
ncbi:MAG: mechanosensitive ion channel domain-containing protein [Candidatus Woesearchaeota archaeon]